MAASLNRATLIGFLGRDPEVRRLQSGAPVVNLRVATSDSWRDKRSGERVERTEWHTVVIFNENLCRIAEQYLRKGSQVYVEGKLQTRKWVDQSNQDRYSTEIVLNGFDGRIQLLDLRRDSGDRDEIDDIMNGGRGDDRPRPSTPAARGPAPGANDKTLAEELDDEIPF